MRDDRLLETTLLLLSPLIESFSKDDGMPDNDAFLPAQSTDAAPATSAIRQLLTRVYQILQRYFSGLVRIMKKYPLFSGIVGAAKNRLKGM